MIPCHVVCLWCDWYEIIVSFDGNVTRKQIWPNVHVEPVNASLTDYRGNWIWEERSCAKLNWWSGLVGRHPRRCSKHKSCFRCTVLIECMSLCHAIQFCINFLKVHFEESFKLIILKKNYSTCTLLLKLVHFRFKRFNFSGIYLKGQIKWNCVDLFKGAEKSICVQKKSNVCILWSSLQTKSQLIIFLPV